MSKINTNMASVTTLYHLTNKEGSMNKALERISSGLRLNHAVDDAAGASIVNRMTSQIKGIEAAIRNAADAISLTQTAEGSLEEVAQILHRMRELAVQAANGVYTGQDRQAINNEVVAMQNELGRIAESSRFNGVKMLNGEFQDTTFQIGFQANDTATLSIEDVRPQGLGEYVLTTSNSNVADVVIGNATATRATSIAGSAGVEVANVSTSSGFSVGTQTAGDTYTVTLAIEGVAVATVTTDPLSAAYSTTEVVAALEAAKPEGANYTFAEAASEQIAVTFDTTGNLSGTGAVVTITSNDHAVDDHADGTFAVTGTGTKVTAYSTSAVQEGDITLNLAAMSGDSTTANTINKIVADNPGGVFTLSGTDNGDFVIDAATGKVTATLDYENQADADTDNVYEFEVNYSVGGVLLVTEDVELTVTDRIADNNDTEVPAFAQPKLGTSLANVSSGIVEEEDFTIYGNVGTEVIDVNGGSSARDIVASVNAVQGETGVYAEAQTRVNMSFPDQSEALSDTVSFTIYGKNSSPQVISGTVDFGVTGGRDANVRGLAEAINSASGATGITAKVSATGATLTMISNEGYDIVVEGFELTANDIAANVWPANESFENIGDASVLKQGSLNNNSMRVGGVLTFHSPYVFSIATAATGAEGGGLFQQTPGAATLSAVSDLNVLTIEGAKKMLTSVDGALVRIDLERSDIGATMSRMEHTIKNLSNIALNTKGARSRIQDADIAAETVELNRAQVLSQAAQAMLAQANRTSQSILSLLQG
jgi:flagellin